MWAGFLTDSINKKSEKEYFDFDTPNRESLPLSDLQV